MPTRHIALVPEFGLNPSELARVSAALQKQVTRDLAPVWGVSATVDSFPSLEDVPAGYWPIVVTFRTLAGEAGIHIDRNGHPYALVEMCPSWSVTASHICLEMVTDPFGSRTFPGVSPRAEQGDVEFSGGICDPCEHPDYAYLVNDVLVSDFCTPAFFEPMSKDRRCFTGTVKEALEVLPGGHMCWYDPATNGWWIRRHADGTLTDVELGLAEPDRGSVREFIDRRALHLLSTKMTLEQFEARVGSRRQRSLRASQSRAYWLRASLGHAAGGVSLEFDDEVHEALDAARASRAHPMVGQLFASSHERPDAALPTAKESARLRLTEIEDNDDDTVVMLEEGSEDAEVVKEVNRSLERVQAHLKDIPRRGDDHAHAERRAARPKPASLSSATPPPIPIVNPEPARVAPTAAAAAQASSIAPAAVSVAPPRAMADTSTQRSPSAQVVVLGAVAAAFLVGVGLTNVRTAWPFRTTEGSGQTAAGSPNAMPVIASARAGDESRTAAPVVSPAPLAPPPVVDLAARGVPASPSASADAPHTIPPDAPATAAIVIRPPAPARAKMSTAGAVSGASTAGGRPPSAADGLPTKQVPTGGDAPVHATRSSEPIEGLLEDRR
jgi:hypothetical protein